MSPDSVVRLLSDHIQGKRTLGPYIPTPNATVEKVRIGLTVSDAITVTLVDFRSVKPDRLSPEAANSQGYSGPGRSTNWDSLTPVFLISSAKPLTGAKVAGQVHRRNPKITTIENFR